MVRLQRLLDKRICWHPEGRCGFTSAGSLEELCTTVTMCGRKYGLWRFVLVAWGVREFTQKLSPDSNYCFSFRVFILIAFHRWFKSIFVLSFCRLPVSVRIYLYFQCFANSCFPECELLFQQRGARDCLWAKVYTRLEERDARVNSKTNSNSHTHNQMPSKLFLWKSDKLSWPPRPWITIAQIFLEQLSRVDAVGSSKNWEQQRWSKVHRPNVHRRNGIVEMPHSGQMPPTYDNCH